MAVDEPSESTAVSPITPSKQDGGRVRLGFLDGIRGWAAIYVVLFHIGIEFPFAAQYPLLLSWTHHGHYAVSVFIVLSGYCLMLPVIRSADGSLPGGFSTYIRRRARRLIPPYYAAFGFSLLVVTMSMLLHFVNEQPIDRDLLQFRAGNLVTHALVVHNLSKEYHEYTNPALWSVGTEWQIYFLFPALLLPVWRRFGTMAAVVTGVIAGVAPMFLLPAAYNLKWASLWYLGTFAMGMGAAVVGFSPKAEMQRANRWRGWVWVLAIALIVSYLIIHFGEQPVGWQVPKNVWITDLVVGIATSAGIILLANASRATHQGIVWRFLQSRLSERLGLFSYSLYLVHMPIGYLMSAVSNKLPNNPWVGQAYRTFLLMPAAIGGAWLFYWFIERHFVNSPPAQHKRATPSEMGTVISAAQPTSAQ